MPQHPASSVPTRARLAALLSFSGRYRVLHLTWFAFFLSFVVWFNFAPFSATIGEELGLSREQLITIGLCNVALTVPARVLIGMALDRWGPRRVYASILVYAAFPCTLFAMATSFPMLVASRLALSIVGAGFVVGIRMVSEWFPPREMGTAEGVYGGWGNFGSAAAALVLPTVAVAAAGLGGWRLAVGTTGVLAGLYGLYYLAAVTDTPDGVAFARPRRQGALEVTSRAAVFGLLALNVPLVGILGLVAWRLMRVGFLSTPAFAVVLVVLAVALAAQSRSIVEVNAPALAGEYDPADRYPFRSVAVLSLAYAVTFGSELAVVSMLPTFFGDTFGLSAVAAGATASAFAFMNLAARPIGGLLSDVMGSRTRTLRVILLGLSAGYTLMALVGAAWPVAAAVAAAMFCSFFVQAGEGATYAIVPLVKKRVSGQISGIVGAYGNVGALVFLTLLLFAGPTVFFLTIGASAVVAAAAGRFLVEPTGSFDDVHADVVTARVDVTDGTPAPAVA
ncbi:NarK family nitrate/nitrite MFS transporter [Euzebya rosea]|uniref:NarK family nitrate/nitrite MFS transporter n=1 Tax=Euzebya rosea TaxID=2052804 RepID=UPI000D3E4075|nr:NarK family nitrate/nitrite MFS transporter [Euzebya rosea]